MPTHQEMAAMVAAVEERLEQRRRLPCLSPHQPPHTGGERRPRRARS
ncbi:MAG: hypothetical protein WD850_02365 [Candidatus Spechtbacterales bacterium]